MTDPNADATDDHGTVWVDIPPGFIALPLANLEDSMTRAEEALTDLAPTELRASVAPAVGLLTVLLSELTARDTRYCGLGHHLSAVDGSVITSSLTITVQKVDERRNPRLLLADLAKLNAEDGERGQADLIELVDRPVLFFEHTRALPAVPLPGVPQSSTATVFQLEAMVPSDDGRKLVAIDFSTPFESHGPEFRAMVVQLAASVSFEPPADEAHIGDSITGRLNG
jgi:hypothetical protein